MLRDMRDMRDTPGNGSHRLTASPPWAEQNVREKSSFVWQRQQTVSASVVDHLYKLAYKTDGRDVRGNLFKRSDW